MAILVLPSAPHSLPASRGEDTFLCPNKEMERLHLFSAVLPANVPEEIAMEVLSRYQEAVTGLLLIVWNGTSMTRPVVCVLFARSDLRRAYFPFLGRHMSDILRGG